MNLNFVLGTAAELIKVYPVIIEARKGGHAVRVIATGQSRENFLMQYRDFSLPENELVWLIEGSEDLEKASSAFRWFKRALFSSRRFRQLLLPSSSHVLVHGDTLSTLAGAWLGWRAGIPVVHLEAGLRSPRLFHPFPEEITRRLVSWFACVHMAPDSRAAENLRHARGRVVNTGGNTLMDAVRMLETSASRPDSSYAMANIHRFENLNSTERWKIAIRAVVRASARDVVVFVTHPQTRHKLSVDLDSLKMLSGPRIEIRERMPFSEFIGLLKGAEYLISDGGSNQEECSYLGKPCLLLRDATERQEGLGSCCLLSRFDESEIGRFLDDPEKFKAAPEAEGHSPSRKIIQELSQTS